MFSELKTPCLWTSVLAELARLRPRNSGSRGGDALVELELREFAYVMFESTAGEYGAATLASFWNTKWRFGGRRMPKNIGYFLVFSFGGLASVLLLSSTLLAGGASLPSQSRTRDTTFPSPPDVPLRARNRVIAQIEEKEEVQDQHFPEQFDSSTIEDGGLKTRSFTKDDQGKQSAKKKTEEGTVVDARTRSSRDLSQVPKQKSESRLESKSAREKWMPPGTEPKLFGVNPTNWDEQRAAWLDKHPRMRVNSVGKQRMLLVSASHPRPCTNAKGGYYLLKSMKNKIDYCRQHNIEIFYNLALLDKEMHRGWAKLPLLRKLMLSHPEIEWFFWMDEDAFFTDMVFEIPMDEYRDYNMVMPGWPDLLYKEKSWVAINDGVFFLRNCQWSLDFIDMWTPMGADDVLVVAGKLLSSFLSDREDEPASDQSALAYLLLTREELRPKVKLISYEYQLSGYWVELAPHYEENMANSHPGFGDNRWPFITHFPGCKVCTEVVSPAYKSEDCLKEMERAFTFADNQVLHSLGYKHERLGSVDVKRFKDDTLTPLENITANTWATPSKSFGLE